MDVEKIANGLNEEQRRAFLRSLLAPLSDGSAGVWKGLIQKTDVVWPKGCAEHLTCNTPGYQKLRLTPLGLAVREYLEKSD